MGQGSRHKLILTLLVIAVMPFASLGAGPGRQPTRAKENPEFRAYLEAVQTGRPWPIVTPDGRYLGHLPIPVDMSHTAGLRIAALGLALPESYDLRALGRVTPVKDQGQCGSCWAFASYGSLESWLLGAGSGTWDLSENNLKECHGFVWGPCSGGNHFISSAYLARRSGPISETDDPYYPYATGCTSGLTVRRYLETVLMPPDRSGPLDNDTLKQTVMEYGAVYTSMYYNSNYYNPATYTYYYSGTAASNHAVAIVGWDDNKVVPGAPGNGAWIVKNSWGTGWGESGYFYISYYDSKVGKDNAVFVDALDPDDTSLYQYDPLGWVTSWGYEGSQTAWGANVFSANADGELTAVSTYAATVNTAYEIYIKDALNGTVLGSESGTFTYPGYHTVEIDPPVSLVKGNTFVAVVKYTTPGYNYPVPAECRVIGYSNNATANPGESYISSDGFSWEDITDYDPTCNFNIKATVLSAPAAPTNLIATAASRTRIDLHWQDNSDNEDGFRIERKAAAGSYTEIDTVEANVTSYSDPGLEEGTLYCYRVRAYNGQGNSDYSNESCATPTIPTVFRVSQGGDVYADRAYYCGLPWHCFNSGTGADIAEEVATSEPVEPGDLLELDPEHPGYYRKSRGPLSTLAAGVVSTTPGITMGRSAANEASQDAALAEMLPAFDHSLISLELGHAVTPQPVTPLAVSVRVSQLGIAPSFRPSVGSLTQYLRANQQGSRRPLLALVGVVPVKVTTENGPIEPGDLLVSSSTPGRAMRCSEPRDCRGAIIGKALEPLREGVGVIRMLVRRE